MPQAETSAWPTDGTAMFVPTTDHEGEPVFVVLAKRTYELRPGGLSRPRSQSHWSWSMSTTTMAIHRHTRYARRIEPRPTSSRPISW